MLLAKLAIRQPVFICMVLLALMLVGGLSYMRMGVDLYPDMSNPTVSVSVSFSGASPEDVERLVTKPLEETFSSVSGVENISSNSREGFSSITLSFVVGHSLEQGAQEVRERLDTVKRRLPDGAGDPTLMRFDPNTSPIINAALRVPKDLSPAETRRLVEEIVTPRLQRLAGVGAVSIGGLRNQEIAVDLNARQLKALGISPQQVVTAISRENVIQPSGRLSGATEEVPLRTSAELTSLDDIRRVVVSRPATGPIMVQNLANVELRLRERSNYNRINGEETLTVSVQKQSGSNQVEVAHLVKAELASLSRDFPQLSFEITSDDSVFIEESDRDVTLTLILGAILAAAIVLLFFRNLRNTLITVAGLPIVVIGTFAVISWLGFSRNIMTLMALSLSIGLLIDDAIVVRENIFRHMEGGASPREAAEKATGEIAFAVLAMTLTIVAVFIPVTFTQGQVGMLLREFGITVAVAALISLFEAFTFAPLLTAFLARPLNMLPEGSAGSAMSRLGSRLAGVWPAVARKYAGVLAWSLRHRWQITLTAVALFAGALVLVQFMNKGQFPVTDPGAISVGVSYPPGTTLEKTDQTVRELEQIVLAQPEVKRVRSQAGSGNGSLQVTLKEGTRTDEVAARLRQAFSKYGRTVSLGVPRQFMGVGGGGFGGTSLRSRPILIAVRGPIELDDLEAVTDQVMEQLRTVPGIKEVDKSLPAREPEIQITVDRQRAGQLGVSPSAVGSTIRTLVSGSDATQLELNGQRTNVTVQLRKEDRGDVASLMDMSVAGTGGQLVPLRSVARMERSTGPTQLERQNRQRQIMVGANIEGRALGAMVPDVQQALDRISYPAGVTWRFQGELAQTDTAFNSIYFALAFGLIFIYMVLASQFGSFIHPVTVMVALPLSAIGAVVALIVARADLTIVSAIGIILLMGLATKNSILLVDFIIRYRRQGMERTEAVIAAGPVRLRPIIMTTLAVVLGMVPTALGIGAAGGFRAPMAIAVIGGVVSSTVLSLMVVPVAYTLVDDAVLAVSRLFRRGASAAEPASSALMPDGGDEEKRD